MASGVWSGDAAPGDRSHTEDGSDALEKLQADIERLDLEIKEVEEKHPKNEKLKPCGTVEEAVGPKKERLAVVEKRERILEERRVAQVVKEHGMIGKNPRAVGVLEPRVAAEECAICLNPAYDGTFGRGPDSILRHPCCGAVVCGNYVLSMNGYKYKGCPLCRDELFCNSVEFISVETFLEKLKATAERGEDWAKIKLAETYLGVDSKRSMGFDILHQMANQGYVDAQSQLASAYRQMTAESKGKKLKEAYKKSRRWFMKAVQNGSISSLSKLALMLHAGIGGPEDNAEAVRLHTLSASIEKNPLSMFYLGAAFKMGIGGLVQSSVRAKHWFEAALGTSNDLLMSGVYVSKNVGEKLNGLIPKIHRELSLTSIDVEIDHLGCQCCVQPRTFLKSIYMARKARSAQVQGDSGSCCGKPWCAECHKDGQLKWIEETFVSSAAYGALPCITAASSARSTTGRTGTRRSASSFLEKLKAPFENWG